MRTGEDKEFIVISLFSVTMKCKFSPFKWKNSGRTVLKCSNIVKRRIKYTRRNSYFGKRWNNVFFSICSYLNIYLAMRFLFTSRIKDDLSVDISGSAKWLMGRDNGVSVKIRTLLLSSNPFAKFYFILYCVKKTCQLEAFY